MGKIVEKLREKYQVDAEQTALIDAIEVEFENSILKEHQLLRPCSMNLKGKQQILKQLTHCVMKLKQ